MAKFTLVLTVMMLGIGLVAEARPDWGKLKMTSGDAVPGRFIVVLKPDIAATVFLHKFQSTKPSAFANATIHSIYKNVINGFSAKLTDTALQEFLEHDEVLYVEEDSVVRAHQMPGSWGIDRVDQRYLPLDGQAQFTGDGSGVSVYVLDTGIYPDNVYFAGRAAVAFDAVGGEEPPGIDCNGHGTHCAGTVGADSFGIARGAALYGVRVLNCLGSGSTSQIVNGLDWVMGNALEPAVASMSLGGSTSASMDAAVTSLIESGVPVSVSAGNNNGDACEQSPAGVPEAITVAATDMNDSRAYFSNYGTCVDIFAPGVDITSTWIGGDSATDTISGTSMSCPHVTGAVAIVLGNEGSLDPAQTKRRIVQEATADVVQDPQGSPNLLLYIP